MVRKLAVRFFPFLVLVNCALALECPEGVLGGNCTSPQNNESSSNASTTQAQEVTTITPKPISRPKSMNMLSEDQLETLYQPKSTIMSNSSTPSSASTEEPKGRALNFTMDEHGAGNVLHSNVTAAHDEFGDLSDVSIDDEDEEEEQHEPVKVLPPKTIGSNATVGTCQKGGLTYEKGEKLEIGCDSVCTCTNGQMDCKDRCSGPFFRKGKKIEDPLCFAKETEDPCCQVLVCSDADTETEPLEMCTYLNHTYHRGETFHKGCEEVCTCEIAGKTSCKPRCAPVNKTSDRCVEIPDPDDSCCKQVLCDVTLDDHEKDDDKHKLVSAKFINSTTVELKFNPKLEEKELNAGGFIEASSDKVRWETYKIRNGKYVEVKTGMKYLRMENTEDIVDVLDANSDQSSDSKGKNSKGSCSYKGKTFKTGEEHNDNCTSLCVCHDSGNMKCLKLECPTYFGVDVLDPNCIEWETVPPKFVPSPPNCCPEEVRCKNNGSCIHEGMMFQNWQQLPANVTGCEKRCYCEMGKVECQDTCPLVTALPPPHLPCPQHQAVLEHSPDDDCCKYWMCRNDFSPSETGRNDTKPNQKESQNKTDAPLLEALPPSKGPSKAFGPLQIYTNRNQSSASSKVPMLAPDENPYYSKTQKTPPKDKTEDPFLGPFNPNYRKPVGDKSQQKGQKPKPVKDGVMFVTPPSTSSNYIPNQEAPYGSEPPKKQQVPKIAHVQIHGKGNSDELLQFINQHPEIANYPPGSVVEIHNIPANQKPNPPPYINHNGVVPINRPHQIVPYVVPQGLGHVDDLPPGITIDQILQEIHKTAQQPHLNGNPHIISFPPHHYPATNNGPVLVAPQSGPPIVPIRHNASFQGGFPVNYPNFQQPQEEVSVHTLEAVGPHTVRLAFVVPSVIVGLHGRVEVRYTHRNDEDFNSWELQVFAPPNDLIATPQLEFDLLGLKADTEYKIKITITLRDLHNTPSSRIYTIKTPKDLNATTLPPMIPIKPDLAITDINATWVTVVWRKFTEYELQFIDGVQLRFKEIDGKIYDATPLIHRSVTSYTLENLKANSKYEIGIFFIPFPGQLTELHADHMLHFTTANEINTYGFNVTLDISHIKSTSVEIAWSGVPYPEDKYVNIYRAIYQSDSGKEDHSTFKIAKRDSPTKTVIMDLKPGTRYRLWLEVYLTNGKIKTSNVQDFITKPRAAPALGASSQQAGEQRETRGDYYGPLVIVAILASIAILSTLVLLLILVRRHNQNKAAITPPSRVSQSAYDNPTYKVEIQQETMGL